MGTLREKIFNTVDIERETVRVDEWGVDVEVRTMSGADRARYLTRGVKADGETDFERMNAEVIIATCFDPATGEKLFKAEDRDAINAKSAKATGKLIEVAMRLAGLSKGADDEVKNS